MYTGGARVEQQRVWGGNLHTETEINLDPPNK